MKTAIGDVHGMVVRSNVNRPLTEQESEGCLVIERKLSNEAHYAGLC
jgi:hypothetical protein